MRDYLIALRRVLAFVLDFAVLWAALEATLFVRTVFNFDAPGPIGNLWASGFVACYFVAFEALGRGQTPGKRICGVSVMSCSGRRVTVYQSSIRVLLIMFFPVALGLVIRLMATVFDLPDPAFDVLDQGAELTSFLIWPVTAALTRGRTGLHDYAAATVVSSPKGMLKSPPPPPRAFLLAVMAVVLFSFGFTAMNGLIYQPQSARGSETVLPSEYDVHSPPSERTVQLGYAYTLSSIIDPPINSGPFLDWISRTVQSCRGHQLKAYFATSVFEFLPDSVTNSAAGVNTCVTYYVRVEPRGITSTSFHEHIEGVTIRELFSSVPDSVAYTMAATYEYSSRQRFGFATLSITTRRMGYWVRGLADSPQFLVFDPDDGRGVDIGVVYSLFWVSGR